METKVTSDQIKSRLRELNLTIDSAAKRMDMSRQNLTKHLSKEPLSDHFIRMFKETFGKTNEVVNVTNDPVVAYGRKAKPIAYINLDVSASDVDVFNDLPETSLQISIPGFSDCEFAFPIYGHSMYPIYESGSIIICKRITDLDVINFGEAYLVITKEQRMLKRVMKGETTDAILLTSDNNEKGKHDRQKYESFELKKEKIKHLFLVKGSIKQNQI